MHRKRTQTLAVRATQKDDLVFTDLGKLEDDNDGFDAKKARAQSVVVRRGEREEQPDTARTGFDTNRALLYAASEGGAETKRDGVDVDEPEADGIDEPKANTLEEPKAEEAEQPKADGAETKIAEAKVDQKRIHHLQSQNGLIVEVEK